MQLTILKTMLDQYYGFDVLTKTRKQKYVYARKILFKLANELGFGPTEIAVAYDTSHDLIIHHNNTFSDVKGLDLMIYNRTIESMDLPIDTINSKTQLIYGDYIANMVGQLSSLSVKELRRFNENKLKPFLQELKSEEEIRQMGYESESNR
tara:strand:+ start:1062 stop:1514 length:453 start_codon:yes stop_codon:yes gene_type:complete